MDQKSSESFRDDALHHMWKKAFRGSISFHVLACAFLHYPQRGSRQRADTARAHDIGKINGCVVLLQCREELLSTLPASTDPEGAIAHVIVALYVINLSTKHHID
jgi:hypothetical protein